jgi:site-specific DNA-methyltransferase (adenine-specific)
MTNANKTFFENSGIKIIKDDVITTKEVREKSIDLITTSPPYNLDIKCSVA